MTTPVLPLSNIVSTSVTVQVSSPGDAAFDLAMVIDTENVLNTLPGSTPIAPQVRTYGSLVDMLADGFLPWHRAYRLAAAIFGQDARPDFIKVAGYNSTIGAGDPSTFLTALRALDPYWFALLTTVQVDATVAASVTFAQQVSAWCLSTDPGESLFFCEGVGALEKGSTANIFSYFKDHSNDCASGWWHAPVHGYYSLTFSAALITGNSVSFKLNGQQVTVAFNADNATTLDDVITAILALNLVPFGSDMLQRAFKLSDARTIMMQAAEPNEVLSITDFAVTGGASQALATFGEAGQTVGLITISAAFIAANSAILGINGVDTSATVFATTSDAQLAAIATKLAALAGVGYAAPITASGTTEDDRQILITSLLAAGRLDLTKALVTGGASQATIAYALQSVSPDYQASAAAVGECIAATPGTKAWSNRALNLVQADGLTTTEYAAIQANNANVYQAFSQNRNATRKGTVATGLSIRNKVIKEALIMAIQLAVFDALQQSDLQPMTDAGIQAIKAVVDGVGGQFKTQGALASFVSTFPKRSALASVDVSAGILKGCSFVAVSAGEIQQVVINGTLQA